MFKVLDSVRKKPPEERKAIALFLSAGVTAVIFVVWGISFIAFLGSSNNEQAPVEGEDGLGTFMDSFKEASSALQQEIGIAKKQLEQINAGIKAVEESESLENDSTTEKEDSVIAPETEVTPSGVEIIRIDS